MKMSTLFQVLVPALVVVGTVGFILVWSGAIARWITPPIKREVKDMQDIEDYANQRHKEDT